MQNPIELTFDTVVVVNGKKCVLRMDPESNNLVAYPVKTEGDCAAYFSEFFPTYVLAVCRKRECWCFSRFDHKNKSSTSLAWVDQQRFTDGVLSSGKRGRGRPRKSEQTTPPKARDASPTAVSPESESDAPRESLTEQENSAAQGLLGLSDCGEWQVTWFRWLPMFYLC